MPERRSNFERDSTHRSKRNYLSSASAHRAILQVARLPAKARPKRRSPVHVVVLELPSTLNLASYEDQVGKFRLTSYEDEHGRMQNGCLVADKPVSVRRFCRTYGDPAHHVYSFWSSRVTSSGTGWAPLLYL